MILSAGRGNRLRPITETTPKALITIDDKSLIVRHLEKLRDMGLSEVVINISHLADKFKQELKDGSQFGIKIHYSQEPQEAFGTAGGIRHAIKYFNDSEVVVINSDVLCDYDLSQLKLAQDKHAHIILVDNPLDNPSGDFSLENGLASLTGDVKYTFAGIGIYRTDLFRGLLDGAWYPLSRIISDEISKKKVSAEYYRGQWYGINDAAGLEVATQNWVEQSL